MSLIMRVILGFGIVGFMASSVSGSCEFESVKTETTVFGTLVKYCEYEGLKLLPGSRILNKEKCEEAICSDDILSICGIGIKAGHIQVENGCVVVPDGCNPRVVGTVCQRSSLLTSPVNQG